jgi:hypothetical protein
MIHALKFIVLQGILLAGLIALYINGTLEPVTASDAKWFVAAIGVVAVYGLAKAYAQQWSNLAWVSQVLVRLGIIGLQIAMVAALVMVATNLVGTDMVSPLKSFLTAIGQGLYASIAALMASVILDTNAYFLGADDAE